MNRKRYAPLINVGAGVLAIGECVGEVLTGNAEAALDSAIAATAQFAAGVPPYLLGRKLENIASASINGADSVALYANKLSAGKFSKSVSYNVLPFLSMAQIGTNLAEEFKRR